MSLKINKSLITGSLILFIILGCIIFCSSFPGLSQEAALAPDFHAVDVNGKSLSLSDYKGEVVLLHITNIENPLCRECEHALKSQTSELEKLKQKDPGIEIVTLNVRKNPYSMDGKSLAESWWNINVSWPWVEDFEPYPLTSKYIDYSTLEGGFANPTLILIDKEGQIASVYHVYQLGKGEIDGIQSADSLYSKIKSLEQGETTGAGFNSTGMAPNRGVTYLSMLFLGIITSLSPCSVALLLAMFSYVMTSRRKEEYLQKSASASKEGFMIGVAFTLGMALVFFIVGLFLSDIGVFIRQARFFDLAAGLLMIILGVNIFKPIGDVIEPVRSRLPFSKVEQNDPPTEKKGIMERLVHFSMDLFKYSAFIGAFTLGIFFALGWAPCAVSLVFPVLIWLISQNVTPLAGGMMLFAFGIGHGVPVIPISTFSRAVGGEIGEKYIATGKWITKLFGLAVILIGLIYAVRYFGFKLW
jgi:cytochrome c-type biogenesis protein